MQNSNSTEDNLLECGYVKIHGGTTISTHPSWEPDLWKKEIMLDGLVIYDLYVWPDICSVRIILYDPMMNIEFEYELGFDVGDIELRASTIYNALG